MKKLTLLLLIAISCGFYTGGTSASQRDFRFGKK